MANYWTALSKSRQAKLGTPRIRPTSYRVLALDLPALKTYLQKVPTTGTAPTPLALPLPNGTRRSFQVQLSGVMAPELAAKYPELRAYIGRALGAPGTDARFEVSATGLRAMITAEGKVYLIESYRTGDTRHYICFDKAQMPPGSKRWQEPSN
ncbi:hypothetical protein [Hymenobacter koreensis]|uniref:hypothetical protein n=1 Tax=Hymenobacter koreensis TaxID=1084523 RepID=UPI0031E5DFB7